MLYFDFFQNHRAEYDNTSSWIWTGEAGGRDGEETQAGDGERKRSRKEVGETDRNGEKLWVCQTCCHDSGESDWEQEISCPYFSEAWMNECILSFCPVKGSQLSADEQTDKLSVFRWCVQWRTVLCPLCHRSSWDCPAVETTGSTGWSAWNQNWPCLLS